MNWGYVWIGLTFFGVLLGLYGEFVADEKGKKKQRRWFVVIGGGVVASVAVIVAIQQQGDQVRIDTLTSETRAFVSGGDSYVVLLPAQVNQEEFLRVFVAQRGDDVPAFDVRVSIEPGGKCDEILKGTWHQGDPRQSYFAAVTPHLPQIMQVRLTPTCSEAYYQAYVDTRNRLTYQQIVLTKTENAWMVRSRVLDVSTGEILFYDPAGAKDLQFPEIPRQNEQMAAALRKRKKQ
jgi:hypothetical protein